jgi:hypothetical protein
MFHTSTSVGKLSVLSTTQNGVVTTTLKVEFSDFVNGASVPVHNTSAIRSFMTFTPDFGVEYTGEWVYTSGVCMCERVCVCSFVPVSCHPQQ